MRFLPRNRGKAAIVAIAALAALGMGTAVAATSSAPSNALRSGGGHGINEFGMTQSYFKGGVVKFRYTKGFFCDTTVGSAASSGCEAGQKYNHAPAKDFDPLYITVPLGFSEKMGKMDCPSNLVCVDHPGTMDLTRLEPALKPLYPQLTDAQLTDALKNFTTPGHNHFITTKAHGEREWWDVRVVGVTDKKVYDRINAHESVAYLKHEIKAGKTTGVIPTNLFLFFAVK
jgi:hypothetical protein